MCSANDQKAVKIETRFFFDSLIDLFQDVKIGAHGMLQGAGILNAPCQNFVAHVLNAVSLICACVKSRNSSV